MEFNLFFAARMIKIIIDDAIPYVKGVLEPFCQVEYLDGTDIDAAHVADAQALMVRTRTRCDAALLEDSDVRLIVTATIGFDHIDTKWCRKAGIQVFNAAGCNARGVLQWLAAVLAYDSTKHGWQPQQKTMGVVGTGSVGSLSAKYADLWGFRVLCCDPLREAKRLPAPVGKGYTDLETVARECDIITFHTPLTYKGKEPTFHMAGTEFFSQLREGALIINSSRGEVVDTATFSQAIAAGRCRGAVDTWEHEPLIDPGLLELVMPGTPHIAGYTAQGKANASAMSVTALASFLGFPLIGWYPPEVERTAAREIGWEEMCATIKDYFDIEAEDARLRCDPSSFETLRTNYRYRREYF